MKLYLSNHNGVLDGVGDRFERVTLPESADRIILWQDIYGQERKIAENFPEKTIVMEHGYLAVRDYVYPANKPLTARKVFVWGDKSREMLINGGIPKEKVIVTGSVIHDDLPKRIKTKSILFCPIHWDGEVEENKLIANELRKTGYIVKTKINEDHNPDLYDNPIFSNRNAKDHVKACYEALKTARVVVTLRESTFETMAHALSIPVIVVDQWTPKTLLNVTYDSLTKETSEACVKIKLDELEGALKTILETRVYDDPLAEEFRVKNLNFDGRKAIDKIVKAIYES